MSDFIEKHLSITKEIHDLYEEKLEKLLRENLELKALVNEVLETLNESMYDVIDLDNFDKWKERAEKYKQGE